MNFDIEEPFKKAILLIYLVDCRGRTWRCQVV